jgi:hypothetical protein
MRERWIEVLLYIHRCDGKAFLNLILLLMFLTFDFTWWWHMAGTSCDYENKNLIYNKITVMVRVLFSPFCCWHCLFLKDTQKMKKNIVSDAVRSHGKVFCTVNSEEVYKAVDVWLMDRQPFGVTKFEGSLGWHHTSYICNLAPSEACTPLECSWPRFLYFLHVLVANCVVRRVDICIILWLAFRMTWRPA